MDNQKVKAEWQTQKDRGGGHETNIQHFRWPIIGDCCFIKPLKYGQPKSESWMTNSKR